MEKNEERNQFCFVTFGEVHPASDHFSSSAQKKIEIRYSLYLTYERSSRICGLVGMFFQSMCPVSRSLNLTVLRPLVGLSKNLSYCQHLRSCEISGTQISSSGNPKHNCR